MSKYRKKPVVIEAFRLSYDPWPNWFSDHACTDKVVTHKVPRDVPWPEDHTTRYDPIWAEIKTLEGVMRADCGDYIIKGVKGEIYPCKPDIFAETYEVADV